jgi:competence protein ComGF
VLVERILILNFCLLEHEHSQDEDQHVQNQYEIFVRQIDELIFRQSMKKLIYGR